jgi:hypothetical protein
LALPQFEQALALDHEQRDTKKVGWITSQLGVLARERGDSTTAWKWLSAGLAILRELSDVPGIVWTLNTLADVAILDEDPAQAEALVAESHRLWQNDGSNDYCAWLGHSGDSSFSCGIIGSSKKGKTYSSGYRQVRHIALSLRTTHYLHRTTLYRKE